MREAFTDVADVQDSRDASNSPSPNTHGHTRWIFRDAINKAVLVFLEQYA